MSLLLQALQKAAKHREGAGPELEAQRDAPPREPELTELSFTEPQLEELELADVDDLFESEPTLEPEPAHAHAPEATVAPIRPERPVLRPVGGAAASGGSAQAATILRAGETPSSGVLDWVRDRPVHTFAILGAIFAVFYGTYVYLQISHPAVLRGDFLTQWMKSTPTPPPSNRPISPPPTQTAAVAPQPAPPPAPPAEPALAGSASAPHSPASTPASVTVDKDIELSPPPPKKRANELAPQARAPRESGERSERTARRRVRERPSSRDATFAAESATLENSVAVRPQPGASTPTVSLMRAWEALQQGRYAEARTLYREVLQIDAQNVDALLGLGAIAGSENNVDEAARHYGRALEVEPQNSAAQAGLISLLGQADPHLSETRLKLLIANEPSSFLYFALGNLYARQGQWAQAQPAYFQAYELQSDNPDYAYNLAVALEHLNQPKIALNYYRRALELGSRKGHTGFDQARVGERIGQLSARISSQ